MTRKLATSHPRAVVHPRLGEELAHAGVDEGEAGAPGRPRGEAFVGPRPRVDSHGSHLRLQAAACGLGTVVEDVGVELPPAQLGAKDGVRLGAAELATGAGGGGSCPTAGGARGRLVASSSRLVAERRVVVEVRVPEPPGGALGGLLAGGRQSSRALRLGGQLVRVDAGRPPHAMRSPLRWRPSDRQPGTRERAEHLVGVAGDGVDGARRDGVGGAGADELDTSVSEGVLHMLVSGGAVGPEVLGDVDRVGAHLPGDLRHRCGRVTAAHDEAPADRLVERPQVAVEEARAGRGRRIAAAARRGRTGRRPLRRPPPTRPRRGAPGCPTGAGPAGTTSPTSRHGRRS